MSDDIDIEEHDIFESPIIKAMFPDISEIKKELNQYLGDDVTIKRDPELSTVDDNQLVHHVRDTRIKAEKDINIDRIINTPLNIATGFLKTRVMGSKPNINAGISKHAGNVKEKFASEVLEREHTLENNLQSSNVIIGSKTGPRLTDSDKNIVKKLEPRVQIPNVNLQDIEAHLKQSKRYCIKCKTLFPNRHNYNKHMKDFHVIKSATNNSKTMNTRQNSLKIRIQLLEEKKLHYKHKCSMCGLRFGTLFRLSQHHRNIHQTKASLTKARNMKNIHMCSICQSSFTDRNNLNRHHRVFHKKATIPSLNNRDSRNKSKKELENRNIKKEKQTKLQTSKFKVTSNTICTVCNIHFCSMYSLKRHTKNIHNNKEISFLQAEPEHKNNNKCNNNNEFETLQPCFHCDEIFPSQASLISHIYSILGQKEESEIQEKNETVDSVSVKFEPISSKNRIVFENEDVNNILKVQENNTTQDEKKDTSKTSFDDEFLDTESHHSVATVDIPRHKNKRKLEKSEPKRTKRRALDGFEYQTITENSSPKKSEIEVQKLSTKASESPEGNASNTEFKRFKFRIVSAPTPIYVSPTLPYPEFERMRKFVLESIIYKCNKCDINFLSSYIAKEHNKHTELLVNWKCSVCKKYFKQYDKHLHLKQHEYSKTINVCAFNETELSRLLYNCTKCTIHFTEERYLKHFPKCGIQAAGSVYCKNCDILIDKREFASHEELHKMENSTNDIIVMTGELIIASEEEQDNFTTKKQKDKQNNRLIFCNSCKCYLTDKAITRIAHVKGSCSNIVKYTCELCGLVFTNKSINAHREHHKQRKDLNLQDFTFLDRKGNQIPPPIPSYNQCKNCDIFFLHKNAANTHLCSEMEYKVCKICNVKLTESAFKLHINFHMYSMHNDDLKFTEHTSKHASDVSNAQEKQREKGKINKLEHIRLTTEPYCKVLIKTESSKEVTVTNITAIEPENGHDSIVLNSEDESEQIDDIIFTCQSCEISTTSYDKVIEHCQNHYDPTSKTTNNTIICKTCSLKFDANSHEKHQKFHHTNSGETKNVHFLRFDPTYFTADNTIWTQHVFASLTPSKQNEIVEKSIYPPECRIKMDIIQKGPYHLTVYKCNGCGQFIDPDFVIEHFEEACHRKCRKYPCPLCGLSLYTSEYRAKHVKLHNVYKDIKLKSYNIALINCTKHRTFNDAMINSIGNYVLYQCRACAGIVDKEQRQRHQCNVHELQECGECGLVLHRKDYNQHVSKHKQLPMYKVENMKVILFGRNENIEAKLMPKFKGTVCDFQLFKCDSCEVCVKEKWVNRHVCVIDDSKWKCPKCSFYISSSSIKQHIKLHDAEPDFKIENMEIISFKNKKTKVGVTKTIDLSQSEKDVTQSINPSNENTQVQETVQLYKCACDLHFLDETSARDHTKKCFPKKKRTIQNCLKCQLSFTPNEIFKHVLAHHSDKNKNNNYKITEVLSE